MSGRKKPQEFEVAARGDFGGKDVRFDPLPVLRQTYSDGGNLTRDL
jgi:hypothetical protein